MRWPIALCCCLVIVSGCGKPAVPDVPVPAGPMQPPDPALPEVEPPPPAIEQVETPLGRETVVPTMGGSVAFNATAHTLRIERQGGEDLYQTAAATPTLTGEEQDALVARLIEPLRYPTDRVAYVTGTAVRHTGERGNELTGATFYTRDDYDTAVELYRGRFAGLSAPSRLVTTPAGDGRMAVFAWGWGAVRLRVLVRPGDEGAVVEATQVRINGAAEQSFDTGQGLLKPRSSATGESTAASTEPAGRVAPLRR